MTPLGSPPAISPMPIKRDKATITPSRASAASCARWSSCLRSITVFLLSTPGDCPILYHVCWFWPLFSVSFAGPGLKSADNHDRDKREDKEDQQHHGGTLQR